jgi:hypothetical protein
MIVGIAIFTILPSRVDIKTPTATSINTIHLFKKFPQKKILKKALTFY